MEMNQETNSKEEADNNKEVSSNKKKGSNIKKSSSKKNSNDTKSVQSLVLPPHWFLKQSRSRQGRIYYANAVLKTTTWDSPPFVPCPALCDDCQAYQAELKKTKKKKKSIENLARVQKKGKQNSQPKVLSAEAATDEINLKLYKKLKKADLFTAHCKNPSKIEVSRIHSKEIGESSQDSEVVCHSATEKALRTKRSDSVLDGEDHPSKLLQSKCISKTSEDSLQGIPSGNTPSSSLHENENQRKNQTSNIHQERNCLDYNYPSSADLSSRANLTFVPLKPGDMYSPPAAVDTPSTRVSFVFDVAKKLSSAIKRPKSSDEEDFADKFTSFKKSRPSRNEQSSQEQSKSTQLTQNSSDQCNTVRKLVNTSTDKPSLSTANGPAQCETLSIVELSSKNRSMPNEDTTSSGKVKLSVEGCTASLPQHTDTQISLPSENSMEVDIVTELQTIRKANCDNTVDINLHTQLDILNSDGPHRDYLYAVVDTNVLISQLQLLHTISLAETASYKGQVLVVVIPYTALQELDSLKSRESLSKKARAAIRWCNYCFSKRDASVPVRAQSFANYRLVKDTLHGVNGDDHIRDCCLFLQQQGYCTALLSDDINLRNKALVADITAIDSATLANDIHYSPGNKTSGTSSPSTVLPAVASGGHTSTPASSARTRHQTYVVRGHKQTPSTYRSGDRKQESVDHSFCTDPLPSLTTNDKNSACSNIGDTDDPMEGITSPVNSPDRSRVSVGSMSVSSASLEEETKAGVMVSPRLDNSIQCTCKHSQDIDEENRKNSVLKSLETTLGNILKYVMEKEYGDLWIKIVKHKPPWTLAQILDCWKKHWMAALMDKFPRTLEKRLKSLERLTSSRRHSIDQNELERTALQLFSHFRQAPYKDLVQLSQKNVSDRNRDKETCSSKEASTNRGNNSVSVDNNENMISLFDVSRTPLFPPVQNNDETETIQTAKDLIIITGNRMGQFVSEGVSFLTASRPQPSLLGPLNALRTCIGSLHASFMRCQQSCDAASADDLSAAVLQFWVNAKEEEEHQRFLSSEAGRAAVKAFVRAEGDTDFMRHCFAQLCEMQALLDTELNKATDHKSL